VAYHFFKCTFGTFTEHLKITLLWERFKLDLDHIFVIWVETMLQH